MEKKKNITINTIIHYHHHHYNHTWSFYVSFPFKSTASHYSINSKERLWSTMECSQPTTWTTNRNLLVAFQVKAFPGEPINSGSTLPELHTWTVASSGDISVTSVTSGDISVTSVTSGDISVSPCTREMLRHLPTCDKPPGLSPACIPSTTSIPAPTQPFIAMTNHTHPSTVTNSSAFHAQLRRFCDYPQVSVVTPQQQLQQQETLKYLYARCRTSDSKITKLMSQSAINLLMQNVHHFMLLTVWRTCRLHSNFNMQSACTSDGHSRQVPGMTVKNVKCLMIIEWNIVATGGGLHDDHHMEHCCHRGWLA